MMIRISLPTSSLQSRILAKRKKDCQSLMVAPDETHKSIYCAAPPLNVSEGPWHPKEGLEAVLSVGHWPQIVVYTDTETGRFLNSGNRDAKMS